MHPSRELDLIEILPQLFLTVRKNDRDLANIQWFASVGSFKNDVLHLPSSQCLGALLTQNPTDCVRNIAFATSIGSDHSGHARFKMKMSRVGKTFEAVCF